MPEGRSAAEDLRGHGNLGGGADKGCDQLFSAGWRGTCDCPMGHVLRYSRKRGKCIIYKDKEYCKGCKNKCTNIIDKNVRKLSSKTSFRTNCGTADGIRTHDLSRAVRETPPADQTCFAPGGRGFTHTSKTKNRHPLARMPVLGQTVRKVSEDAPNMV